MCKIVNCSDHYFSCNTNSIFSKSYGSWAQKSIVKWSLISWLTHWGRVTHIFVGNLTSIGSDNGLSPGRRQAIIRTNAGILLKRPLGTNFSEILTHWGRVTHICVSKLTIIGSDNGLSPDRRQAIIWINAGLLLIGPLGTNFTEILIEIRAFSFKKMRLKVSFAKWRPFCLGLNVLIEILSFSLKKMRLKMSSAKWRPFCLGLNELTHWGLDKCVFLCQLRFQIY